MRRCRILAVTAARWTALIVTAERPTHNAAVSWIAVVSRVLRVGAPVDR
jgi:hypothetical protein